ncbi:MAG: peptide chain release factor N(5)-glutamine methyltransferase [Elusimicrobiales bacterium]|nr:peptide chain release factor N(5)-glutamine methyltransferase [Elusimicrobiales bacterium]HOL62564.1 peptide chain release factor N(5)-glutamine methyltransferase [Elusimicrobiales bacterium]HPO94486.1 peptide chain release factor N(5)-glutamine methyltransferase [Elusimicrobiales bacterium]
MNIAETKDIVSKKLEKSGIVNPSLNAEHIISHILKINRLELCLYREKVLSGLEIRKIMRLADMRACKKPLSWVLKSHNFCGLNVFIKEGVFVPRPETEELCEIALKKSMDYHNPLVLDFCAGSGAIGLAIAFKNKASTVYAIEKMKKPYSVMVRNKNNLNLKNYRCALSSDINFFNIKFDILVSNPPYIPLNQYDGLPDEVKSEPKTALFSGKDGLKTIRYIAKNIPKVMKKDGFILIEAGEYYSEDLKKIFDLPFIKDFEIIKDFNGKDRFIKAVYSD